MLVALYTHRDIYASDTHHRYTLKFYLPFTCKFVLENLPGEANVLIHTRNVPLVFILFLTFNFFCWSIFDMLLMYFT